MSAHRYLSLCLVCACCGAAVLALPAMARATCAPGPTLDRGALVRISNDQGADTSSANLTTGATVTLFSDDFEGAWGWWPASTPSGWFLTTYRSDGGTHSAHASSGVGASAMMDRGPFDLSNATGATLDFDLWYYAPQYIYGGPYSGASGTFDVGYSLNGSLFYFPVQWAGDTGGSWAPMQWDMSGLCGQPQVWIAFGVSNASSMYAGHSEGPYVDNVTLSATFPDTTPPTTTATGLQASASAPWQKSSPKITLSATDNTGGSGVAHTYFTIDGGTQQTYAVPFYLLYDGAHTVSYWSVDKAGNTESAHSGYVKIDSKAPTTTAKALSVKAAKAKKGKTLKIKLTIADPVPSCGTADLTLTLTTRKGAKLWSLVKSGQPTNKALVISRKLKKALAKGTYFIVCRATDAAGNLQATASRAKLKIT